MHIIGDHHLIFQAGRLKFWVVDVRWLIAVNCVKWNDHRFLIYWLKTIVHLIAEAQQAHPQQDHALRDHERLKGRYKEFLYFLIRDFELN